MKRQIQRNTEIKRNPKRRGRNTGGKSTAVFYKSLSRYLTTGRKSLISDLQILLLNRI